MVVEITEYPEYEKRAVGVITEVLGEAGEKDVDLKSVIVQHNLPDHFPEEVLAQARHAVESFDPDIERENRLDLSEEVICTIDPDDAKDYDDAISLKQTIEGHWELGVHIADVSFFVKEGSPLDVEAQKRGNSTYFPGFVIPMLPEMLSNGVCSLQEGVPRLCKSAFITLDDECAADSDSVCQYGDHQRQAAAVSGGAGDYRWREGDSASGWEQAAGGLSAERGATAA